MPGHGKQESQAFADYLSIGDRYSAQTNFDSENTIGGRFRVNRAHKRKAAFLPTVMKQQQWHIGDSLLNSEFGRLARDRLTTRGPDRNLREMSDLSELRRLTRQSGSVKDNSDAKRAYRATTYLLDVLTDVEALLFPVRELLRARKC
jgi:hypothetical protein